jgi:small-conductance mechanosensitive channel
MKEGEYLQLFHALKADIESATVLWQLLVLGLCFLVAALVSRQVGRSSMATSASRSPADGEDAKLDSHALRFGRAGLLRLAFPVTALLLVFTARAIVKSWMPVNLLNIAVPLMVSLAAVRMVVYVLRLAFANSRWLAASERVVAFSVWTGVALHLSGLSTPIIAALEGVKFSSGKDAIDLWMVLHGAFMVVVTILAALWVAGIVEARLAKADIDSSLRAVFVRIVKAVLTLVAILFSLSLVGIDITALSVFGGAVGVGLGFGLQKIASNYVSGFIILLERSIRIGDVIAIDANNGGVVTQITTRYTVIRTPAGTESIVPNENLVSAIVQNQSYTDRQVRLTTRVGVAYDTDIESLIPLMVALAEEHPRVLKEPAPAVQVVNFGDNGIDLELGFWIPDPEEGTGNVRSDINRAILKLFRERGIEIPFPQREVRMLAPR